MMVDGDELPAALLAAEGEEEGDTEEVWAAEGGLVRVASAEGTTQLEVASSRQDKLADRSMEQNYSFT
jgi:hypothetical protein